MRQRIEKLEAANIAPKPWQMMGEAGGNVRPHNSLLEEDVSFDHTTASGKNVFLLLFFFLIKKGELIYYYSFNNLFTLGCFCS